MPVRIEKTFYYPALLMLSEDFSWLAEDFRKDQDVAEAEEEAEPTIQGEHTIQLEATLSAVSARGVEGQASTSPAQKSPITAPPPQPSPSTLDQRLKPTAYVKAFCVHLLVFVPLY